jgi:hypothetical protein
LATADTQRIYARLQAEIALTGLAVGLATVLAGLAGLFVLATTLGCPCLGQAIGLVVVRHATKRFLIGHQTIGMAAATHGRANAFSVSAGANTRAKATGITLNVGHTRPTQTARFGLGQHRSAVCIAQAAVQRDILTGQGVFAAASVLYTFTGRTVTGGVGIRRSAVGQVCAVTGLGCVTSLACVTRLATVASTCDVRSTGAGPDQFVTATSSQTSGKAQRHHR